MAAGDTLRGYRAATVRELYDGPPGGYLMVDQARVDAEDEAWLPSGDPPRVLWVKDPTGTVGRCSQHQVTEHEDGTVTVSPSILNTRDSVTAGWHGYLERGIWREV